MYLQVYESITYNLSMEHDHDYMHELNFMYILIKLGI